MGDALDLGVVDDADRRDDAAEVDDEDDDAVQAVDPGGDDDRSVVFCEVSRVLAERLLEEAMPVVGCLGRRVCNTCKQGEGSKEGLG